MTSDGRPTPRRDRVGGFVLVAVLSALALMAAVVGAATLAARGATDTARLALDLLVLDALFEAGIAIAGYQLYGQGRPLGALDGEVVRFDDGIVRLAVETEAAFVDLNGAEPELLAGLWRAARRTTMAPEVFAARVVDWRDADLVAQPGGAEAPDYGAAPGRAPRDAPFRTVAELGLVLGVTATDVGALAPFVTVHNPDGTVDPSRAAPTVLAALPGATPAMVERVVAARSRGLAGEALALLLPQVRSVATGPSRAHRVQVTIERPGFGRRTGEAVLVRAVTADALHYTVALSPPVAPLDG
ncbi:general secretion pathway protein GspK [Acuticoccus sp.]|uniref:general secretion pathway protein GspK n=1 Tax=Acuticoccus sp. TaxID=1904378 RepID=UPI003B52A4D3